MKKSQSERLYQQIVPVKLRKGDLRKLEIVKATIDCIATEGLENTNYETIGRLCDMKRPHVAYYFPDRKELLITTIRYVFAAGQEILIEHIRGAQTRDKRIAAYIEGVFLWLEAYPYHRPVMAVLVYLSSLDKDFVALNNEIKRMAAGRISSILLEGSEAPTGSKVWCTAEQIHTYLSGEVLFWLGCRPTESSNDFQKRTIQEALRMAARVEGKGGV